MKLVIQLLITAILVLFLAACGQKASPPPVAGILDEISGVWRAKNDGTMVSIIYADKKVRLLFGEVSIPVSLGEIDNVNKTANMNVTLPEGKPGVWTIRQMWDKDKTSFHLQITLHDGVQDDLAFVRKISTDDMNKIANAEARIQPGSIGDAAKGAKPAEPVVAATSAAAIAPPPPAPAPVAVAPTIPPAPQQSVPQQVMPAPVTWTPSFDCNKASTGPERLICSSKELSEADVRLAQAYKSAANSSGDKESLKNAQIKWRTNERDACSDVKCMLAAYQNRLTQLSR